MQRIDGMGMIRLIFMQQNTSNTMKAEKNNSCSDSIRLTLLGFMSSLKQSLATSSLGLVTLWDLLKCKCNQLHWKYQWSDVQIQCEGMNKIA